MFLEGIKREYWLEMGLARFFPDFTLHLVFLLICMFLNYIMIEVNRETFCYLLIVWERWKRGFNDTVRNH